MATWSLPQTKKSATELARLMKTPVAAAVAEHKIYHLLGDDELSDNICTIIKEGSLNDDVRVLIALRLEELLNDYAERPDAYDKEWEPAALVICHKIIKKFFPD